jgi:hypothetical protein
MCVGTQAPFSAKPKEWRILERWLKLQRRAQNETNRGKLAKILGKMGGLVTQMEKRTIPLGNDAQHVSILGRQAMKTEPERAPLRKRVLIN